MVVLRACQACGALSDQTRCPDHRTVRLSPARRGYDAAWRRTRARFLAAHPTCEHPDGCGRAATDVHHRDGQGPTGPAGHDPANLQALCQAHHAATTARMQPGGWAA